MSNRDRNEEEKLIRVADMIVDELLDMTPEELRNEATEQGVDLVDESERFGTVHEKAQIAANKSRLRAAQESVAADREKDKQTDRVIDIARARKVIARLADADNDVGREVMLAARKANQPLDRLPEEDVIALLEDLKELGLWSDEGSD